MFEIETIELHYETAKLIRDTLLSGICNKAQSNSISYMSCDAELRYQIHKSLCDLIANFQTLDSAIKEHERKKIEESDAKLNPMAKEFGKNK